MTKQTSFVRKYQRYTKKKRNKASLLRAFRLAMPEIIFRTTKLEGESITRRMVNALFR